MRGGHCGAGLLPEGASRTKQMTSSSSLSHKDFRAREGGEMDSRPQEMPGDLVSGLCKDDAD